MRENGTWKFWFCSSSFFLSFLEEISSKTIVCMQIYTYQTTALLPGIFRFWLGWRTSYDRRATATKLPVTLSEDASCAWSSTSGASAQLFRVWHIFSSHTQTTECVELWEPRWEQKVDYSFLYLHVLGLEDQFSTTEDAVVHLDTFWIPATW